MTFATLKRRALALSPLLFAAACSTQSNLSQDLSVQPTTSFASSNTESMTASASPTSASQDSATLAGSAEMAPAYAGGTPDADGANTSKNKLVQVASLTPQNGQLPLSVNGAALDMATADPIGPSKVAPVRASSREQECLARAMFFESNRSSREGMLAVGTVVMNRVESGRWANSVCGTVGAPQQFAPGVMTKSMNAAGSDLALATAAAILAGERHPKIYKDVMYFHTAGYRFGYDNMHYVAVAGGNSFYEKRRRMRGQANRSQQMVMAQARDAGRYAKPIQAAFKAPWPSMKPIVVDSPVPVQNSKPHRAKAGANSDVVVEAMVDEDMPVPTIRPVKSRTKGTPPAPAPAVAEEVVVSPIEAAAFPEPPPVRKMLNVSGSKSGRVVHD